MADCVVETCNRTVVNAFHALLLTCMFSSLNIQSTYSYWLTLFVVKDHLRDGVLVQFTESTYRYWLTLFVVKITRGMVSLSSSIDIDQTLTTDKGQVCRGLFIARFSPAIKMLAESFEDCEKKIRWFAATLSDQFMGGSCCYCDWGEGLGLELEWAEPGCTACIVSCLGQDYVSPASIYLILHACQVVTCTNNFLATNTTLPL